MFRSSRQRIKTLMWGLILSAGCGVCAISASGQTFRTLSKTVSVGEVFARGVVTIDLNKDSISADELKGLKVKVEFLPSGEIVNPSQISLSIGGLISKYLSIHFTERPKLNLTDNDVRISVYREDTETKTQNANLAQQKEMLLNQYVGTLETAAKLQIAYAKTSRERHFYFSGGFRGGEAAVNPTLYQGDVWKTSRLINQIDFGLAMDRGTGTKGDPDFLNLGVNFRKIFPLHKKSITRLLPLESKDFGINSMEDLQSLSSAADRLNQENKNFFRAIVVTPLAPGIETSLRGHGAGFLINFVNNFDVQVRTGTKRLLGQENQSTINRSNAKQPRGTLTWEMKLIPVALETGVAIRNPDDPGRRGNPLVRLNTGAVGKLTYHFPCRIEVFVNRLELEVKGMNRHLFNEESALNPLTNKADALVRGNKYAAQVDLRHVFGFVLPIQSFRRRPAVTVTYKNGFFPPLYTYNNSVSVHFTLESEDDTNVSDMKLSLRKKN